MLSASSACRCVRIMGLEDSFFQSIMIKSIGILVIAVGSALAQDGAISAERIRADTKFLSSDLLEGRGVGQRGGQLATEYIATQLELAGAKPLIPGGSY